jgi:hypothetical protein
MTGGLCLEVPARRSGVARVTIGVVRNTECSPDIVAESGTVEEIDQFVEAGKPALLYFSRRPIDPNKIDLEQHQKLRNFKDATYKKALTGSFSGVDELRQTLLRDLMRQVRELGYPLSPGHPVFSRGVASVSPLIPACRMVLSQPTCAPERSCPRGTPRDMHMETASRQWTRQPPGWCASRKRGDA